VTRLKAVHRFQLTAHANSVASPFSEHHSLSQPLLSCRHVALGYSSDGGEDLCEVVVPDGDHTPCTPPTSATSSLCLIQWNAEQ
ncbi:hypothetical protein O3P69_019876, partial [Scylla paramamosain]